LGSKNDLISAGHDAPSTTIHAVGCSYDKRHEQNNPTNRRTMQQCRIPALSASPTPLFLASVAINKRKQRLSYSGYLYAVVYRSFAQYLRGAASQTLQYAVFLLHLTSPPAITAQLRTRQTKTRSRPGLGRLPSTLPNSKREACGKSSSGCKSRSQLYVSLNEARAPKARRQTDSFAKQTGDLAQRLATESVTILQPDFTTTNVILEPKKRAAADVSAGIAVYCAEPDE
jgi:hypothetical protein